MPPPPDPKPGLHPAQGALVLGLCLALVGLAAVASGSHPSLEDVEPLGRVDAKLDFGTYRVTPDDVVDGDTIRVAGPGSVRILGVDCEERFHTPQEREAAREDFDAYASAKRGTSVLPVKFGTPAGLAATEAARELIAGAERVRLEKDDASASDADGYGRLLAHVVLLTPSGEVLLAEALIENGHSPYFVKYGRSLRYDRRLAHAERRARIHRRGIWSEDGPDHYPDYAERLAWWHERADQVDRWRARPPSPADIDLAAADAEERLRSRLDQEATVFGVLRSRRAEGSPRILWLRHVPRRDFAAVVFNVDLWNGLDHAALDRLYVAVTGKVTEYRDRPQILVEHATQVTTP